MFRRLKKVLNERDAQDKEEKAKAQLMEKSQKRSSRKMVEAEKIKNEVDGKAPVAASNEKVVEAPREKNQESQVKAEKIPSDQNDPPK